MTTRGPVGLEPAEMHGDRARAFLVRHGRTALNAAGELRGHLDPPLDEVGRAEADALARSLAGPPPARIVSSPLRRARETAGPLSRLTSVPVIEDAGLIDRDYGAWAGHHPQELVDRFGSVDAAPGVEPAADVLARARAVLDEQFAYLAAGPVVLVAHDVVNRLLLHDLDSRLGDPGAIPQRTGCWNLLTVSAGSWRVVRVDQL